jgi:hypothetical protein
MSISAGGGGDWHYRDHKHAVSLPLLIFTATNQSFFMSTFFFISGVFSASAVHRQGPGAFAIEKLLRLSLPALIYSVVSVPLQNALREPCLHRRLPTLEIVSDDLSGLLANPSIRGPVWYLVLLCIFDCAYAGRLTLRKSRPASSKWHPRKSAISISSVRTSYCITGILLCSLVSFLVRLRYNTNYLFRPLNLRIGYVP